MIFTACLPVCGMSVAYILSTWDARTQDGRMSFLEGWTGHLTWCREVVVASSDGHLPPRDYTR